MRSQRISRFREIIYGYYARHGRDLPWRKTRDPYRILVSEIMLQQTQVERVLSKYNEFIRTFPDFPALASARLGELLTHWQGLGYNRRGKALKEIAETVLLTYGGKLPGDAGILCTFPGIGKATAAAISVFAFNKPCVLIETNVRRVFIHFFFRGKRTVSDSQVIPLVEKTLDASNPRRWYWALMDYGVMLRKKYPDLLKRSAHYRKQSPFKGSDRQIRGAILRMLTERSRVSGQKIARNLGMDAKKVSKSLRALEEEGLIERSRREIRLP